MLGRHAVSESENDDDDDDDVDDDDGDNDGDQFTPTRGLLLLLVGFELREGDGVLCEKAHVFVFHFHLCLYFVFCIFFCHLYLKDPTLGESPRPCPHQNGSKYMILASCQFCLYVFP